MVAISRTANKKGRTANKRGETANKKGRTANKRGRTANKWINEKAVMKKNEDYADTKKFCSKSLLLGKE